MSEAKHTPGPWRISRADPFGQGWRQPYVEIASTVKPIWIAKAQTSTDDSGEMAANARLIAAAPELLETLKIARNRLFVHQSQATKDIVAACDAVIAKAEGRA